MLKVHLYNFDVEAVRLVKPYIYVATPYTNYREGRDVAHELAVATRAWLVQNNIRNFTPIVHSHLVSLVDDHQLGHQVWLDDDEPFLHLAGGLLVVKMHGWDESDGIKWELGECRKLGRPSFEADIEVISSAV